VGSSYRGPRFPAAASGKSAAGMADAVPGEKNRGILVGPAALSQRSVFFQAL
jgi:hypothetical protein